MPAFPLFIKFLTYPFFFVREFKKLLILGLTFWTDFLVLQTFKKVNIFCLLLYFYSASPISHEGALSLSSFLSFFALPICL